MANKKFSWNAKTPMTSPDMVANPVRWNPMDKEWKKRVEAMQLYNEDATAPWLTNEMKKTLRALRDRILTFGGDEVLLNTRDEDAEKVLERGQFFYNRGRCQIATGYALSEDGLWRQHSWVVQPMTRTVKVWETTVERVAYFGVVLNDEECQEFFDTVTY